MINKGNRGDYDTNDVDLAVATDFSGLACY